MEHIIIDSLDKLQTHIASGNRELILVGGEIVYVTDDKLLMEQISTDEQVFILQPPRLASRGSLFSASKHSMFLGVTKEAASFLADYKGGVAFLADQYLAYGLSQRGNIIVVGGGNNGRGALNLEILVFSEQRLVKTLERNIENTGTSLDIAMRDVQQEFPDSSIHWCAPLGEPPKSDLVNSDKFIDIGTQPMRSIIRKKVFVKTQNADESLGLVSALLIVAIGAAIFISACGFRWSSVVSERQEYQNEIVGFEQVYSNSAHSLDLLRHRDFFLNTPPEHQERVKSLDHLLMQVAKIDSVQIISVKVFEPGDIDAQEVTQGSQSTIAEQADFKLEIIVPQLDNASARDQAEPLLAKLNQSTGMTVRLNDHVPVKKKIGDADVNYWQYRLSGSIQR